MSRRRRTTHRRAGMTLVEVIMSLVILSGALLGLGRFVTTYSHSTSNVATSSVASDLVTDRLETVKSFQKYANLESTYAGTESSISGYPGFTRVTTILRVNSTSSDYKLVTVTVSNPAMPTAVKKSTAIAAF